MAAVIWVRADGQVGTRLMATPAKDTHLLPPMMLPFCLTPRSRLRSHTDTELEAELLSCEGFTVWQSEISQVFDFNGFKRKEILKKNKEGNRLTNFSMSHETKVISNCSLWSVITPTPTRLPD
ncbi:Hypothetical predicted protein [Xyrichtys novacula]|uniref:Uncharacterized protein n=1 Tax=Xyrichtys novacula TaxID=13765 RepID=A0AAV1GV06_XYRNO|nr:Hypothetical predicted protein [Xyrichtys novacula]